MKVITKDHVNGTSREVRCPNGGFTSYRYLIQRDGMGFGLNRTFIPAGDAQTWHYPHHLEACYCIEGLGVLTRLADEYQWEISPGTVYALDEHEKHSFRAIRNTVLLCVFNPPLVGHEVHDPAGCYPSPPLT